MLSPGDGDREEQGASAVQGRSRSWHGQCCPFPAAVRGGWQCPPTWPGWGFHLHWSMGMDRLGRRVRTDLSGFALCTVVCIL